ncbi:MAG: N-acetyltransferase family protein [Phycisphaerae bacterium]
MATIRTATVDDLPAINEIYNAEVAASTASFDLQPMSCRRRRKWFYDHHHNHPVRVAELDGRVVGWADLHTCIDKEGSRHVAEVSVYVASDVRGRGVGKALLGEVLSAARQEGLHAIIAFIADGNAASVRLHEGAGFRHVGVLKDIGHKFGRYVDVTVMQRILD